MEKLGAMSDYENLREARISENLTRMEMLGLLRCAGELNDVASASASCRAAAGSATTHKTPRPRIVSMTPLRRSCRLTAATPTGSTSTCRRSARLNGDSVQHSALPSKGSLSKLASTAIAMEGDEEDEKMAVVVDKKRVEALPERRCDSRGRGGVYDPLLGICCHFCRQKKLCGEEDCGEGDLKQPCLGKTECSYCHSSNGILCRACLKVRDGRGEEEQELDVSSLY